MLFSDLKKFVTGKTDKAEEPKAKKNARKQKLATIVDIDPPASAFPEESEEDRQL